MKQNNNLIINENVLNRIWGSRRSKKLLVNGIGNFFIEIELNNLTNTIDSLRIIIWRLPIYFLGTLTVPPEK
jgi:hypothetical protein